MMTHINDFFFNYVLRNRAKYDVRENYAHSYVQLISIAENLLVSMVRTSRMVDILCPHKKQHLKTQYTG